MIIYYYCTQNILIYINIKYLMNKVHYITFTAECMVYGVYVDVDIIRYNIYRQCRYVMVIVSCRLPPAGLVTASRSCTLPGPAP